MNYGTVQFSAAIATVDTGDAGPEPDIMPLSGYVDFVPSRVVTYNEASGGLLILGTISAGLDANGVLRDPEGNPSITLIASDSPELSHQGWTWEAWIRLNGMSAIGPYPFVLHGGDTVNLGLQAPLEISNGVAILRGPKGDPGPSGSAVGGAVTTVNGKSPNVSGNVDIAAADIGVTGATAAVAGLIRTAGDLAGTSTSPTVPNRIWPIDNLAGTNPNRPNTQATIAWIAKDNNRPAGGATKSGGAYAAAQGDLGFFQA